MTYCSFVEVDVFLFFKGYENNYFFVLFFKGYESNDYLRRNRNLLISYFFVGVINEKLVI